MLGRLLKRRRRRDTEAREVNPLASRLAVGDDSPTQSFAEDAKGEASALARAPGWNRTGQGAARSTSVGAEAETRIIAPPPGAIDEGPEDPPVGVLLVVAGPGRGRVLPFGHGMNAIGRGADQRVRVDFGDDRISRERHALVTYDTQGRRFFLQHGGGPNLTYLGGEPVLDPTGLADGDRVVIGDTELLFRALVGDDFDWSETAVSAPRP